MDAALLIACACASFLYENPAKGPSVTFKSARLVLFKRLVSEFMFFSWYLSSTPPLCVLHAVAFKLSPLGVLAAVLNILL